MIACNINWVDKMKYLMVDISGKVPKYDIALCEALSKELYPKHRLMLLAANINPKEIECDSKKLISLVPKFLRNSDNKIKRGVKALEGLFNYAYLFFYLLLKKIDVLHFQWLPFLEISSIERFFMKVLSIVSPKTKFILTVHNIYPHNCSEKGQVRYKKRFSLIEKYFDNFILHLECSKNEFCAEFLIDPVRCYVIPHGVFTPKNLVVKPHVRGEKLNLIMYGNQSYYKGTDVLVDALSLLPDDVKKQVHTTIVGKTAPDYLSLLREKGLGLDIEWIPEFVPDDFLYEKIMESDVIVLPYRKISQSGVLLLALCFEKVIITSDLPSFKETLFALNNKIFFESGVPGSLKDTIELCLNSNFYSDYVCGLNSLKKKYSWDNVAKKYKCLVENFI